MYARLKMPYALRGYRGIPYTLVNMDTGETDFLNLKGFRALSCCNGQIDLDTVFLDKDQKSFLESAKKSGVIEFTETPACSIEQIQCYRKADNKYLRSVHWSVTGHCNLKCRHCYMSAPDYKYHDLTKDECFEIIRQFREAGVLTVTITGGDPFVRKDIFEILDRIYQEGLGIPQIYTNGLLLNEQILDWFLERGKKPDFVLSFDCVGCHDWMRGVENVEAPTIEAIRLLRSRGFSVMIETAICGKNISRLLDTYEILKELGIEFWKTSLVFEAGKWKEAGEKNIGDEVLYEAYLRLIARYVQDGAPFFIQLDGFYSGKKGDPSVYEIPYERKCDEKTVQKTSSCLMCRIHPYLLPDGTFLPCASMTDSNIEGDMPNLKKCTISEIYRNDENPFFRLSNIRISEVLESNQECKSCEFRYECGGGCRAVSMFAGNGVMGHSTTLCTFFRNDYRGKIKRTVQENMKKD